MRTLIKVIIIALFLAFCIIGCPGIGEYLAQRETDSIQEEFDAQLQKAIDEGQVIMEIDQITGKVTYRNASTAGEGEAPRRP